MQRYLWAECCGSAARNVVELSHLHQEKQADRRGFVDNVSAMCNCPNFIILCA